MKVGGARPDGVATNEREKMRRTTKQQRLDGLKNPDERRLRIYEISTESPWVVRLGQVTTKNTNCSRVQTV